MTRTRRLAPLVAALATASLAFAGPAAASGGSGGGGGTVSPTPTTTDTWVDVCEGYWDMPAWSDGSLPIVNRTNGGCVIVRHYLTGVNRLSQVVLVPGWTYTVKSNGDGTSSRVEVDLSNPTTGQTASIRVENGKTVIR
jgi:hypothetical protein